MAWFGFGKKKENNTSSCNCNGKCNAGIVEEMTISNDGCEEESRGICCIKVLGTGCSACHQLHKNTKAALANMGLSANTEYITDMEKIMEYGVMSMPVLVVNGKVVSMGKVLKASEVEKILRDMVF